MQNFTSVPFKTESAHGFTQVNGVAKFSSAGVVLEFESKLFGLLPGGVKEVRLPIGEILDIKFKKGMFKVGAKIEIRTTTIAKLTELPNQNGKVVLKIVRDDHQRAFQAVERMQKDMLEFAQSLPPPHTPLSQLFHDDSEEETKVLNKPVDP
ncbi:MAG TPA: hypothetical protein VJL58_11270 [Pyrinomonadaceae bacterium]|nr:hypothetical protein [Pyrinomonadaceae bacterium]